MKTLNKYFIFGDVHGEYDALLESLNAAGYNHSDPTHILVSTGDLFDRGPKSAEIYKFLSSRKHVAVKGNHDVMFQEYLEKGMDGEFVLFNILHNGLGATIRSFTGLGDSVFSPQELDSARRHINSSVLKWIKDMPLYFETQNFIFCHAGINPRLPNWKDTDEHYMLWDIEDSYADIRTTRKFVVIGHHHAFRVRKQIEDRCLETREVNGISYPLPTDNGQGMVVKMERYGNEDEHRIVCHRNKIAIDGCTNLTGKVNVLVVQDYPLEEGKVEEPTVTTTPNWSEFTIHQASYGYTDMGTTIRGTFTL